MKKTLMFALCATSISPIVAAPAMAATAPTGDMQATCAATVISPAPNSTYTASLNLASITSETGAEYEISRTTVLDEPGGVLLSSTGPTYVSGTQGRNGQSPNIFGTFESKKTYSGAHRIDEVVYGQDTTYTYGCTVSKTTTNPRTGAVNVTTPPGLQISGLTTMVTDTRTVRDEYTTPPVTQTELSEAVICNSPLKNPGVWRNQNGYTGTCSTALFLSLSQIVIHSNSLPPIAPVNAPAPSNNGANPANNSGPASVVDTDSGEETAES